MNAVTDQTEKEVLSPAQRWVGLAVVVAMLVLFGFFMIHQTANTGFFTDRFGSLEMLCLYGPIFLNMVAPIVRAVTGRRNSARPLEALASLSLDIGSLWLLVAFPFDFTHLADALPAAIRFLLAWVTDDIGKIPLVLQVFIGPISAVMTTWTYFSVRRQEPDLRRRTS